MIKKIKYALMIVSVMTVSMLFVGCGSEEKEESVVPTRYIDKADDAVEEYNENVQKIDQTDDAIDDQSQE